MCFGRISTDGTAYSREVASGRRVAGAIRSLVNVRDLQLDYSRVLIVPVLMYGIEAMLWLWKEKERSRIRPVQKDILRGLLGIRSMDRVPNTRIMSCAE